MGSLEWTRLSFLVDLACVIVLAFKLSKQKPPENWLICLFGVFGLMLTANFEKLTWAATGTTERFPAVVEIVTSVLNTYLLAAAGLSLLKFEGLTLKVGLLAALVAQAAGFLMNGSPTALKVAQALDVSTCLVAGAMFGIAMSSRLNGQRTMHSLALAFPLIWGLSDLAYYWPDETVAKQVANAGMEIGALGSFLMALYVSKKGRIA